MSDSLKNKKFFFLSGMHRSGNTLLSSILNQNPNFYVSPLSPMSEYLWLCDTCQIQQAITYPNKNHTKNMISKMIENFYDVEELIIFDRSKTWIFPININLIKKYITNNPKIIYTIRPLKECIASNIKVMKDFLCVSMQKEINDKTFLYNYNLSQNDNLAEYLLQFFYIPILNLANESINDPLNKNLIHIVKYDDLTNNPEKTLKDIYSFLELDYFIHNLHDISVREPDLDFLVGIPEETHKIKKQLFKNEINVFDFISKEMTERCDFISKHYSIW